MCESPTFSVIALCNSELTVEGSCCSFSDMTVLVPSERPRGGPSSAVTFSILACPRACK